MGRGPAWRVGVAGLARASIWRRLRDWFSLPQADVVAVADPDPVRRDRAVRLGVPRAYAEAREMLARETLDIVHLAGPPHEQGSLGSSAMMRGLDVMAEVPVAIGSRAVRKMAMDSRTFGGFLVPVWPATFDPAWRGLLHAASAVGRPARLEGHLHLGPEPWWEELDEDALEDPWLHSPDALALGGDRLVHLALELFGAPEDVSARSERGTGAARSWEGRATLLLRYPWGPVSFVVEVCAPGREGAGPRHPGATLVLYGERGRAAVRGRQLLLEPLKGEGTARLFPMAAGEGASPAGWLVRALEGSPPTAGGLGPGRLLEVGRVLAALERSAAASGAPQRVEDSSPSPLPSGPPSRGQ